MNASEFMPCFAKSAIDEDGFQLERKVAIVITAKSDDALFFMPEVAKVLRRIADGIDADAIGNEAYETHQIATEDEYPVELVVEIASLDGNEWGLGGPDDDAPVDTIDPDIFKLLSPGEQAALVT
jgi:hypothetical protein